MSESTPGWIHTCRSGRERWFPYSARCIFCGATRGAEDDRLDTDQIERD